MAIAKSNRLHDKRLSSRKMLGKSTNKANNHGYQTYLDENLRQNSDIKISHSCPLLTLQWGVMGSSLVLKL